MFFARSAFAFESNRFRVCDGHQMSEIGGKKHHLHNTYSAIYHALDIVLYTFMLAISLLCLYPSSSYSFNDRNFQNEEKKTDNKKNLFISVKIRIKHIVVFWLDLWFKSMYYIFF